MKIHHYTIRLCTTTAVVLVKNIALARVVKESASTWLVTASTLDKRHSPLGHAQKLPRYSLAPQTTLRNAHLSRPLAC